MYSNNNFSVLNYFILNKDGVEVLKLNEEEAIKLRDLLVNALGNKVSSEVNEEELKCPTCEDAKPGVCCHCGLKIHKNEQKLEPNPYAAEINENYDLHLECEDCRYESAQDI